jgi:hypothetical protein
MTLRAVLPLLLVVLVVASAAPLWSANDRRRQRPGLARGGLHLVASKRGAILSGRNLAPGDRVTGAVTIANRGTLPGSFTLSGKVRGSRPMAANLVLTIRPRQAAVPPHRLVSWERPERAPGSAGDRELHVARGSALVKRVLDKALEVRETVLAAGHEQPSLEPAGT